MLYPSLPLSLSELKENVLLYRPNRLFAAHAMHTRWPHLVKARINLTYIYPIKL